MNFECTKCKTQYQSSTTDCPECFNTIARTLSSAAAPQPPSECAGTLMLSKRAYQLATDIGHLEAELYAAEDQVVELQRMMESSDKALANAQKAITSRDELLALIGDSLLTQTEVEQRIKRLHCKHETWLGHSGSGRIFCADCGAPHEQ